MVFVLSLSIHIDFVFKHKSLFACAREHFITNINYISIYNGNKLWNDQLPNSKISIKQV